MPRSLGSAALSDRISQFETDLRDAVWELALSVLHKEYVRRASAPAPRPRHPGHPSQTRKAKPGRGAAAKRSRPVARTEARPTAVVEAAPIEAIAVEAAPAPASETAPAPPAKKGRPTWTKERVVEELGNWLIQDPVIDAATLTRRNQSALVAAARRLFGRFDAALNAANLHLAELYPDGPPSKRRAAA
jgi:hypothetical protein